MYIKRLQVFVILLTAAFLYAAPDGKIEGFVYDSQNNEPLPGANVFLKGTTLGAVTDIKGKFVILQVPGGNYKLVVRYIGYLEKTIDVSVKDGQTLNQVIKLDFQIIEGEAITVTAQAEGQMAAINQQLTSNTIANIVSQARIRELPDVNAAESIGRLPGVSISRSGGEATQVQIRGLSAKYNTVTLNGVRVPATGGDDRSVDLSLISSNMLAGIELKKAVTPDMDADVLGGTVDLKLQEAPNEAQVHASGQWGYNRLQSYYGNYNFNGTASKRFFDDRLGIIASANTDDYDRSADKLSGNYKQVTDLVTRLTDIQIQSLNLREESVTRGRTGASGLLDYRLPNGKITANGFYNRLHWDGLYRINRMDREHNSHYYDMEDRHGSTSIFTGGAGIEQDLGWFRFDAGVARTATRTNRPNERTWTFAQENNAFVGLAFDTPTIDLPKFATNLDTITGLSSAYIYDTKLDENQTIYQLNVQKPFHLGSKLNGYLKMGGKMRFLDRKNDENQRGRDGLQYGNSGGANPILSTLDQLIPEWYVDSLTTMYGVMPIWAFRSNHARSDFLNGDYPLGYTFNESMMNRLTDALMGTTQFLQYAVGSKGRDYDGIEHYYAGYIMGEFNFGRFISLLPGVRYEKDYSKYQGQRYREVVTNNIQADPTDLVSITNERRNEFWLPMVHLRVQPADWLKVRLARTETLTRPDYIQYAPITSINSYQSYIRAANAELRPAQSTNYDASISVYQSHLGLFTVSGFYKDIKDLIFQTSLNLRPEVIAQYATFLPGLNIPDGSAKYRNADGTVANWLGSAPQADTYINSPFMATYKGFELDLQTHFWFLPSILRGLVLNINYTRIISETDIRLYNTERVRIGTTIPPRYRYDVVINSRSARMPDQPAHIANVTLGYDLKGFSTRLSYLYQTDKVAFISREPALDNFSGAYSRWDLTVQQKVGGTGLQLFANLSNLNGRPDKSFRGDQLVDPTYIEYYGFTMDLGARYKF
ncbi:MAG: Vitamin B12 transporter BtuB [bacterium]|nr:Vitamin B12 transporter BtuB [bacterium]